MVSLAFTATGGREGLTRQDARNAKKEEEVGRCSPNGNRCVIACGIGGRCPPDGTGGLAPSPGDPGLFHGLLRCSAGCRAGAVASISAEGTPCRGRRQSLGGARHGLH